jgi:hypothetical protein
MANVVVDDDESRALGWLDRKGLGFGHLWNELNSKQQGRVAATVTVAVTALRASRRSIDVEEGPGTTNAVTDPLE